MSGQLVSSDELARVNSRLARLIWALDRIGKAVGGCADGREMPKELK